MKETWRLIITHGHDGAFNMALDETLLLSAASKSAPPTLRLYDWQPATLSLGFAQPVQDVDIDVLGAHGWGLVRRPTGGRAILHTDELTYSVTAPLDDPRLSGSLLESYRKISLALLLALKYLSIEANGDKQYGQIPPPGNKNPVCFENPSNYEITVRGRKLIGSAQARKHGGILQHGSLPLYGDLTRITRALHFANENDRKRAAQNLSARAATLHELLGEAPSWQKVAEAMIKGFSQAFNIKLEECQPSSEELIIYEQLVKTKYATDEWTNRL